MRKRRSKTETESIKSKYGATLSFRMNILFFAIFVLFSILIFRLGYLQIVKGEEYVSAIKRTEEVTVNTSVARGRIYDRYGRILVDNEPKKAITYTKTTSVKTDEMIDIAEQLAMLIDQPTDKITERDLKDFWILRNKDTAYDKVSKEEQKKLRKKYEDNSEYQNALDALVRERITEKDLKQLTDFDLEVLAIYREMNSGYYLSPQIIKSEGVTDAEYARVSERLADLPGVNTTTDWKRMKLSPLAILGRTTVPTKGIPKDKLYYYLARDYARNDRVGESFFEAQYEELLQGQKSVVKNVTNTKGEVVDTVTTFEGKPGKDLVTTIDSELQKYAEKVVEEKLLQLKRKGGSSLLDRAFFIMMNPNTGELLSVVGKKIETDPNTGKQEIVDYSYGTISTSYEVGSTVKGATLLIGYSNGVISPGAYLTDKPIKLAGTNPKSSIFNRSGAFSINDIYALERSSNSYMFQIALLLNGTPYRYNMGLRLKEDTLQKMRNGYAQFGLGVQTGIDLPNESTGYQGILDTPGKILDLAIGQFDTYTPMQMVQYISTIANGGYRVQPRLLKEVRQPSPDGKVLGNIVEEVEPKILNRISNTEEQINHVKKGLRQVYVGSYGTAKASFYDAPYTAAGKTGTAQVVYYGPKKSAYGTTTINIAHVGFAPFDHPEVAYAVVIPWATTIASDNYHLTENNEIAREMLDKYFQLKKKYEKKGLTDETVKQKISPAVTDEKIGEDTEEEQVNE